ARREEPPGTTWCPFPPRAHPKRARPAASQPVDILQKSTTIRTKRCGAWRQRDCPAIPRPAPAPLRRACRPGTTLALSCLGLNLQAYTFTLPFRSQPPLTAPSGEPSGFCPLNSFSILEKASDT